MGRIEEIEKYARDNNVPIMQKDGIEFIESYIRQKDVKNILEIGSAIGYSAIRMASTKDDVKVTTIERDEERYKIACQNIENFNLSDKIDIILSDALDIELDGIYDLIFIDAAKAQNIKFFEKFKHNLSKSGAIITDNLNFHGLTDKVEEIKSKNLRSLVKKINKYKEYLSQNSEFKTEFLEVGDGISISIKRGK